MHRRGLRSLHPCAGASRRPACPRAKALSDLVSPPESTEHWITSLSLGFHLSSSVPGHMGRRAPGSPRHWHRPVCRSLDNLWCSLHTAARAESDGNMPVVSRRSLSSPRGRPSSALPAVPGVPSDSSAARSPAASSCPTQGLPCATPPVAVLMSFLLPCLTDRPPESTLDSAALMWVVVSSCPWPGALCHQCLVPRMPSSIPHLGAHGGLKAPPLHGS